MFIGRVGTAGRDREREGCSEKKRASEKYRKRATERGDGYCYQEAKRCCTLGEHIRSRERGRGAKCFQAGERGHANGQVRKGSVDTAFMKCAVIPRRVRMQRSWFLASLNSKLESNRKERIRRW